jgi:hypothetical protein
MAGDLSSGSHRLIWSDGASSTMRQRIEPKDLEDDSDKSVNWTSVDGSNHFSGLGPAFWISCVSRSTRTCLGLGKDNG